MTEDAAPRSPFCVWLVELFVLGNLAFLAIDIYVAHSYNDFAHVAEWIPFGFSLVSPLLLLPGVAKRRHAQGFPMWSGIGVGITSVAVGISGLLLHLDASFFEEQTLKSLVYTAPFVAPLSYAGVGLLLVLNRLEAPNSNAWSWWVVFLAMCGFVGNFGLSLCDHAQNGFFEITEWIPVVASAFGTAFLLVALVRNTGSRYLAACQITMVLQIVVGLLGFYLHVVASASQPAESIAAKFIYGPPVFAPLLFANLAILALIGLWDMSAAANRQESLAS